MAAAVPLGAQVANLTDTTSTPIEDAGHSFVGAKLPGDGAPSGAR